MQKPIRIAITCDAETITDRRGAPSPRLVLGQPYVDALVQAGADPLLLPHLDTARAKSLLDVMDGFLISGGAFDVPPSYYGEQPRPGLGTLQPKRSAFEQALLKDALRRNMPVLGICGGMQLLNVEFGGTLYQDLSERPNTHEHQQPNDKRQPGHTVEVAPESLLARIVGAGELPVNSTHHQVLRAVGTGLLASASAADGVVEAIEHPQYAFVLGVQWHPEALATAKHWAIYQAFVQAAQKSSELGAIPIAREVLSK